MWILILVIATSASNSSGSAAIQQEFATIELCRKAGNSIVTQVEDRGNYVLTWGCFEKGVVK